MVQTKDQYEYIHKALAQGAEELFMTASDANFLQPTARVASVCCSMDCELMRSCYKPGKTEKRNETKYHVTRSMWTVAYLHGNRSDERRAKRTVINRY